MILAIVIFVLFHFVVWSLYTKQLFTNQNGIVIGDLGRLSYLVDSFVPKKSEQNLPKKHIDFNDYDDVDILTIGDSFSNGGGGGINNYYQDYIASNQNLNVMNLQPFSEGLIETIIMLNNNGTLKKMKPKAIILQAVERTVILKLAKDIQWEIELNNDIIRRNLSQRYVKSKPNPFFINNINYNSLLYNIFYKYDDNAYFSKTYIADISIDLFTSVRQDRLLFYNEDIQNIPLSNEESIDKLNENLNKLQKILNKLNIKLYFMPVVDKYNLYSKYIIDNKYEKSSFFELLRSRHKDYILIDTKSILRKLTDSGVKDIYYSDDTHWSSKASKEIFQNINF